jgi:NAD(P)-dependent dehydrogenase (short-subunit alcohol dehydrogenase family)
MAKSASCRFCAHDGGIFVLAGKSALITGGSRGLGRAIALAFANAGAKVALTYARDDDAAAGVVKKIEQAGGTTKAYRSDVLDKKANDAVVRDVELTFGGLDILVNSAGISQNLPLALIEEDDFCRVMDVNVKGTFLMSKSALKGMIRRKSGVVLNIGSLAGVRMIEAPIHYCTSKAAIVGLTRAMAKEVARHNVRILSLAPGLLEDGMGRNLPDHRLAAYLRHCSLGRLGTLDEAARLAVFLVSDQCSYMTGETVVLDGGV